MSTHFRSRALVLASTSRYRRELLQRLHLPFEVVAPHVDEAPLAGERPPAAAQRLSMAKAEAVAGQRPEAIVIGSDQTATLDGVVIVGKPGGHERAVDQLRAASGRTMRFFSGLALVIKSTAFKRVIVVETVVRFRHLNDRMIEEYLLSEKPYDCAGSAKSEGLGIALIQSLECNDPTALVGLPLIALTGLLTEAGLPPLGRV